MASALTLPSTNHKPNKTRTPRDFCPQATDAPPLGLAALPAPKAAQTRHKPATKVAQEATGSR